MLKGKNHKAEMWEWCDQEFSGHDFEQTLGDGEGQGSLAYCSSWGHKDSDTTERLNNNKWLNTLIALLRRQYAKAYGQ